MCEVWRAWNKIRENKKTPCRRRTRHPPMLPFSMSGRIVWKKLWARAKQVNMQQIIVERLFHWKSKAVELNRKCFPKSCYDVIVSMDFDSSRLELSIVDAIRSLTNSIFSLPRPYFFSQIEWKHEQSFSSHPSHTLPPPISNLTSKIYLIPFQIIVLYFTLSLAHGKL